MLCYNNRITITLMLTNNQVIEEAITFSTTGKLKLSLAKSVPEDDMHKSCTHVVWAVKKSLSANLKDVDASSGDNGQFRESIVGQISIPHTVDPVSQTVPPHQLRHHLFSIY